MAVGVFAALRESGGLWFGWSGEISDQPGSEAKEFRSGKVRYALIDLTKHELDGFYAGFANRTLWPLFHYRLDLASFEHGWYATYRDVNIRFAKLLQPLLQEDDLIWIHDYHLIPLAQELRRLGVRNRMGFFLHIPFPPSEVYAALPWHRELAVDLCAYNVVGFQTGTDLRHFTNYLELEIGGTTSWDGTHHAGGQNFPCRGLSDRDRCR